MSEKTELVKTLIGDYPPTFSTDYSPYRNCYAHALNCNYEDRDYSMYTPGAIYAEFNGNEIFDEDAICVVEWAHFIKDQLPSQALTIRIHIVDETTRRFEFCASNEVYKTIAEGL